MPKGLLVSTSCSLAGDELGLSVRSYPDREEPFVVLDLGNSDVVVYLFDLATLDRLQATVAEARDLLAAALVGQDRLPVESTAAVK